MSSELEDKCLVCLKTGDNLNIFTTYIVSNDKEELYVEVIKQCFNIEITQVTGLDAMCAECSMELRRAYNFRNHVMNAINRLVQVVDGNVYEKPYSEIEYLENQFENDYDINTVLNPETGQISYTLDKIDKNMVETVQDTYLIDLENDSIITAKDANKIKNRNIRKDKRQIDADVVKENIPDNVDDRIKKQKKARVKKEIKNKTQIGENVPDTEENPIKTTKRPRKSVSKKKVMEIMENDGVNLVDTPSVIGEEISNENKDKKECKADAPTAPVPGRPECDSCGAAPCACAGARRADAACKYCDKKFTNVNTRNAHMWRVHTHTEPFKCAQCGERFKTYLRRLRHVQAVHGNAAEYPCQYCDKKFAYAAYRTKHVRTKHLQLRPHKCSTCPFAAARRRELAAHRATKHGDGRLQHQCPVCSRRFYFKTALRSHMNLHQNRYACTQCDAKFQNSAQLEAHRESHAAPEHVQAVENIPILEPVSLQLDELSDYGLIDTSYWYLSEM